MIAGWTGDPCPTLSSLLVGVLNGDTLSATGVVSGSRLTLLVLVVIEMGFVGILGLSARFTGGGKLLAAVGGGRLSNLLLDFPGSCVASSLSASESWESAVDIRPSLLGGTGAIRGEFMPMLPGVKGFANEGCKTICELAVRGGLDGDFGDSTVTR